MWPPPIKPKLLVAIAILPLLLCAKQILAQEPANGMHQTYGLGEYSMDDTQQVMVPGDAKLLKTTDEVMNYKANNADKQIKPCMMELNKDNKFQLVYDDDAAKHGCTVDLVIGPSEKELRTEMKVMDPISCLDDCGVKSLANELAASSANLFPFTYSLSNEQFEKLHKGPPYNDDQTCKPECAEFGGKCMNSATSLQITWNTCATKVKARSQLVGQPDYSWVMEQNVNGKETAIDLIIAMGSNPTVTMQKGGAKTVLPIGNDGKPRPANCFTDDKVALIPELKFWTIKSDNAELNGKHLVVFHFLPQAATRIFDKEGKLQDPPGPEMPKCKGNLAIAFENVVGLLQSPTGPTTTGATGPTTNETMESTTSETAESKSNLVIIIACVAGGVVVLLIIVGVLVWCFCCRDKEDNGEDAETGADTEKEIVKEGAEDVPNSSE